MWTCVEIRPGMMNLPARLIVWAPAGGFTFEAGPTASTLPSRTISAAFSIAGLPEPSMRRAPTNAFTPVEVTDCPAEVPSIAKAARPTQASNKQRLINKALRRIITPSFYSILPMTIVLECCDSKQGEFNRERSSLAIKAGPARVSKNRLDSILKHKVHTNDVERTGRDESRGAC